MTVFSLLLIIGLTVAVLGGVAWWSEWRAEREHNVWVRWKNGDGG